MFIWFAVKCRPRAYLVSFRYGVVVVVCRTVAVDVQPVLQTFPEIIAVVDSLGAVVNRNRVKEIVYLNAEAVHVYWECVYKRAVVQLVRVAVRIAEQLLYARVRTHVRRIDRTKQRFRHVG